MSYRPAWFEYTAVTGSATMAKSELIPTHAMKSYWVDTWNGATQSIGQYFPTTSGSGGALVRGGYLSSGAYAGVFTAVLSNAPSDAITNFGFRCVFRKDP